MDDHISAMSFNGGGIIVAMDDSMEDNANYRVLSNGTIQDKTTGYFVQPGRVITSSDSQDMLARREALRVLAQKEFRAGMLSGANKPSQREALRAIAAAQTRLALSTQQGRASTEAARFVLETAGYIDRRNTGGNGQPGITVSGAALSDLRGILQAIQAIRQGNDNGGE